MTSSSEGHFHTLPCYDEPFLAIRSILSKKPKLRSQEDIDIIADHIVDLKFFKNLVSNREERQEFVGECAKYLKYQLYPKGTEVFRKGDKGKDFYIILQGEALEFFPKEEKEIETDSHHENKKIAFERYSRLLHEFLTQNPLKTRQDFANAILSHYEPSEQDLCLEEKLLFLNDTQPEETPYFIKGVSVFKPVLSYRSGENFGELASIFNEVRLSTIIARKDLHVFSFKSRHYTQIFASEIQNVINKVKFFQDILHGVSQFEIAKFCHFVTEKTFKFHDPICREGESCKGLYFIKSGSVQLSKMSQGKKKKSIKKETLIQRRVVAASLSSGHVFGDFEMVTKAPMEYTALCTSSTDVYMIPRRSYMGVIEKHFEKIASQMREQAYINEASRKLAISRNEKIHAEVLPFTQAEKRDCEKFAQDTQVVLTKLREMYKRNSEVIPLHHKSKYDSNILRKEIEKEKKECSNVSDRRKSPFSSMSASQLLFSPNVSKRGSLPSFEALSKDSMEDVVVTSKNEKQSQPLNAPRIRLSIAVLDGTEDFGSPSTLSSVPSPKFRLPSLNSPKSSFSNIVEKKNDDGFSSIVKRVTTMSKVKVSTETRSNYINALLGNLSLPDEKKSIGGMIASARKENSPKLAEEIKMKCETEETPRGFSPTKPLNKEKEIRNSPKAIKIKQKKSFIRKNSDVLNGKKPIVIKKQSTFYINSTKKSLKKFGELAQSLVDTNHFGLGSCLISI